MSSKKEQIKKEILDLIHQAADIEKAELESYNEQKEKQLVLPNSVIAYQKWYTKSLSLIKQIAPERFEEFILQYEDKKRKDIGGATYTISDYLLGLEVTSPYSGRRIFDHFTVYQEPPVNRHGGMLEI